MDVAYNAFANAADAPTATAIAADNDVFIGGDLETKGGLYLTGRNIYNTVAGVSTGAISLAADPAAIDSYNTLSYGSWLVQNSTNNGIAALMVDQTKGGDIFTASAGGTTKFTITNAGSVGIGTTTPDEELEVAGFGVATRGFVSYDSYFGEEFIKDTTQSDADGTLVQGDTSLWSFDENGACTGEGLPDVAGGRYKQDSTSDGSDCLTFLSTAADDAHQIFYASFEPQLLTKVYIDETTGHQFWFGASNYAAATGTDPAYGIWFGNDSSGGTDWYGKVCSNTTCSTTSSCGAVVEDQFALLLIKASSSSVEFLVDTNISNGISMTSCGSLTTNIPTGTFGLMIYNSQGTTGTNNFLYVDYMRMWQDDPIISPSEPEFITEKTYNPIVGADLAEYYPTVEAEELQPGTIVSSVGGDLPFVQTANVLQDKNLVGIVSTNPMGSMTMGDNVSSVQSTRVALSGRVPVRIDPNSLPIMVGDAITSSGNNGMGQKALKAGVVVGKALESWAPNSGKESILVFVNLGEYDPDTYLANTNDFSLNKLASGTYEILNNATNTIVNKIGVFAEILTSKIKAGAIETKEFATESFLAFQGTIDNLLINGGLVSPVIQTNLISPLADSKDIVVQVGKVNETGESEFGKLIIKDGLGVEVASIDSSGSAEFKNASISGELYAESISSPDLDAIEEILRQVQEDQLLLAEASTWETSTATDSAEIFNSLSTTDLFVTGQAAINSLSVSESLSLGTDMVIQTTGINTLTSPLSLQSLALAPLEIMAGKIRIETNGDMTINANLYVAGKIESPEAEFEKLTTNNLIIAGTEATPSAIINGNQIDSNAMIGTASIPAGINEIVINNANVLENSLIYVTPTSETQNNVLYVKNKELGKFTVGFINPLNVDVSFNWWVVQVQNE